jgi:cobalt-zinc-cadmium efflux system protein
MIHPVAIHYNGMLITAVIGVCVNGAAAFVTRKGESINRKAVNLHMLEDVLGWAAVLIGSVVIRFTGWVIIDPIMSVAVALFIIINAVKHLKAVIDLFLEKTPRGIDVSAIKEQLCAIEGVSDAHHIHIWSMDGQHNCATMHLVVEDYSSDLKRLARDVLRAQGIAHATLELELASEQCNEIQCCAVAAASHSTGHHHSHGGHHPAHGAHHHAH